MSEQAIPPDLSGSIRDLTKREHYAALALQGLLAAGLDRSHNSMTLENEAVNYASRLIWALAQAGE